MEININNCNNIQEAKITIQENKLNIKYGINGTGKSTIANAIENKNDLSFLKTFGFDGEPSIKFSSPINKAVTFNTDFVNNIVFRGSDVIDNSFEVFIKSDQFDDKRKKILEDLKGLNKDTIANENIKRLLEVISDLCSRLKLTSTGEIHKTTDFKSILNKQNIYQIPEELNNYKDFLTDKDKNVNWIDWKTKGFDYDDKGICPFCTEDLKETYNEEKEKFKKIYKKNDVKHLTELNVLLSELKEYIGESNFTLLHSCIVDSKNEDEISLIFRKFIADCEYLLIKFNKIVYFDSFNIKSEDISKLGDIVSGLEIDINKLEYFNGNLFINICSDVNEKIESILKMVDTLKVEIGEINSLVVGAIKTSKREINDFLKVAGYDYEFDLFIENSTKAKTILKYSKDNINLNVDDISKHLSWGEKNAFALVLFMFYALSQKTDLIILDDPISSFDDNKKYAIIDRLFVNSKNLKSLKNKTVLLLTHDFEPVIDFVVNGKPNNEAIVHYIKNADGFISETNISRKNDIILTASLYYEYSNKTDINIISRISFLRKYIELSNVNDDEEKNIAYEILSCLIHGNKNMDKKLSKNKYKPLLEDEISVGINYIKKFISNFNYQDFLTKYYNKESILKLYKDEHNNYLKSQIFREYLEISDLRYALDDVIIKFVDEIYHVENDYIYSLDLIKFDTIPNFIVKKIDNFMDDETRKNFSSVIEKSEAMLYS